MFNAIWFLRKSDCVEHVMKTSSVECKQSAIAVLYVHVSKVHCVEYDSNLLND